MKIKGKKIEGANREIIAIPRSNGEHIIFIAEAVLDDSEFEAMVPCPKPGIKIVPGTGKVPDFDNPAYKESIKAYGTLRYYWMILKSLQATPGLEWETIVYSEPATWKNFESELKSAGLNDLECKRILQGVSDANGLNEAKVNEARDSFLAGTGLAQLVNSSFHQPEPPSTPSGEPAKSGDSNLPE